MPLLLSLVVGVPAGVFSDVEPEILEKVEVEAGVAVPSQRRQSVLDSPQRPVTPIDEAEVESDNSEEHRRHHFDGGSESEEEVEEGGRGGRGGRGHSHRDDSRRRSSANTTATTATTGSTTSSSRQPRSLMVRVDSDTSVGSMCRSGAVFVLRAVGVFCGREGPGCGWLYSFPARCVWCAWCAYFLRKPSL